MDDGPKSLKLSSKNLGTLFIDPISATSEEVAQATWVVFPHRLTPKTLPIAVEWAAASQAPIYCHEKDIPLLVKEGFGAYRFHGLNGYHELSFLSGKIEIYPNKRYSSQGWKSWFGTVADAFGWRVPEAFHVLVRPKNEASVLYLGTAALDMTEWRVLSRQPLTHILCSSALTEEAAFRLSRRLKRKVRRALEPLDLRLDGNTASVSVSEESWSQPNALSVDS